MQNIIGADIVLYEYVERTFSSDIKTELYKFIDPKVEELPLKQKKDMM